LNEVFTEFYFLFIGIGDFETLFSGPLDFERTDPGPALLTKAE
jgi:hypothetical protein